MMGLFATSTCGVQGSMGEVINFGVDEGSVVESSRRVKSVG